MPSTVYCEIPPIDESDPSVFRHLLYGALLKHGAPIVIEQNLRDDKMMRYRATGKIKRWPMVTSRGNWLFSWETK